jgi:hypothetical protein
MKNVLLLFVLLMKSVSEPWAQTLVDSALRYNTPALSYNAAKESKLLELQTANPADTTEGGDVNEFKLRAQYRERNICSNVPVGADMFAPYSAAMMSLMTYPGIYCSGGGGGGRWQCMGPFNNSYGGAENQGRVNSVWVNPINDSIILAATFGGLWKSTNKGHSWHNISDNITTGYGGIKIPGTMGIWAMDVNPLDYDNIYIYMGDLGATALGAAYTTNGGISWQSDTSFNRLAGLSVFADRVVAVKMMYEPGNDILYAFINNKYNSSSTILCKSPGITWINITPSMGADKIVTDLEFTRASPNKAVFSTNAADFTGHLRIFDRPSGLWSNLDVTMPSTGDTITNIDDISISATDSVFMLVRIKNKNQHIIRTALTTLPVTVLSTNTVYGFQYLAVSPNNTKVMYGSNHSGLSNFYQSINGGAAFSQIRGSTHADGRFMTIYTPTAPGGSNYDDVLYGGTDGGVVMKQSGDTMFKSITGDSLCITQFWGLSNMEWDDEDELVIGGAQDNGGITHNKNRTTPWAHTVGSDNIWPKFLRNGVRAAYAEVWSPYRIEEVNFADTSETSSSAGNPADVRHNDYRPWHIDADNTAYLGHNRVWKKEIDSVVWKPAFLAFPFPDTTKIDVVDIIIGEPDANLAYIAYFGATGVDPTGPGNTNAKLFKSTNAQGPTPTWTNITPPVVKQYSLHTIESDPLNQGRIWAGLVGINDTNLLHSVDSARNRIFYSPDYGVTWYDVSRGLPAVNIIKIKYRRSSNDELYCGTGVGTYRCDFSTFNAAHPPFYDITWRCFNDGMPICQVTDMEFNYCSNKLRISTFGRGIWESVLDTIPFRIDTIFTNTTWSAAHHYEYGHVYIMSGATLTVLNDTLHMPTDCAIKVGRGGQLVIDHSFVTSGCENCYWQGIQVAGDNSIPQSFSLAGQGWAVISNSTIQNALNAVTNYNPDDGPGYNGGIITCYNSNFINNQNAATFAPYHNTMAGVLSPDLSKFQNCTFLVDGGLKDQPHHVFRNHVHLTDVRGIGFNGCTFLHRDYNLSAWPANDGIFAEHSGFNVVGYITRPHFSGFTNGINIQSATIGSPPAVSIDVADFDSCGVGVRVSVQNNVSVTRSHFIVGHGNPISAIAGESPCVENVGIFTQNSPMFRIEDNKFIGKPQLLGMVYYSSWQNFGVVAANTRTGIGSNIFRNNFDSILLGAVPVGENGTMTGNGLKVFCDTFRHTANDIFVLNDGMSAVYYQGIDPWQGSATFPAGNVHTSGSPGNLSNYGTALSYYYHGPAPSCTPASVFRVPTSYSPDCSGSTATYVFGGGGTLGMPIGGLGTLYPTELAGVKTIFRNNSSLYNTTLTNYNSAMDFGSTAALVARIDTSTCEGPLYAKLSSGAPYISKTAMKATADLNLLSYANMLDVMKQNPDNLSDLNLLNYVKDIYSLGKASNHVVMALRSPFDPNLTVADTMGTGICMDTASVYYMLDTNSRYYGLDSLDVWLQNIGGIWTMYERMGYYNDRGRTDIADSIFAQIDGMIGGADTMERAIYRSYDTLWTAIKTAQTAGRSAFSFTPAEIASFHSATDPWVDPNPAKMIVVDIIIGGGGGGHGAGIECLASISDMGASKHAPNPPHGTNKHANDKFWVYPNPTSGIVTFMYNVPDGGDDIRVVVTNLLGEKVMEQHTGNNRGSITWDPRAMSPGVYMYQATGNNGVVSKGKLVVLR